jgi:hypothetical protein
MVNTAAPTGEEQAIARRLRTLLSASDSLDVLTEADHSQLVGLHTVDAAGRLLVRLPGDARLAVAVACAPYGDLAAIVELTDVAPVPMRDRVRGRARLTGWLAPVAPGDPAAECAPEGTVTLRLDLADASFDRGDGEWREVGLDELALAEPDPLALVEADLLTHMDSAHAETVAALTRLVPPSRMQGVRAVRPLRMDQFGIELRVERLRGHLDVRLPFAEPARDAAAAGGQVLGLLARSRCCRGHRHTADDGR